MNEWLTELMHRAGEMALDFRTRPLDVETKPDGSPVTAADKAIDRFLHDELKRRYSGDCVLSEEREDDPNRLAASRVWLVDPIDGTAFYAGGQDQFGILATRCEEGEAVETVAHFPALGITLCAEKGSGASVNGRSVRVSGVDGRTAKIAAPKGPFTSLHTDPASIPNNAVNMFRVITGEIEGFVVAVSKSAGEHDYAWVSCALAAAGGLLTDLDGKPLRYNKPDRRMPRALVATNGLVHESLLIQARKLEGMD